MGIRIPYRIGGPTQIHQGLADKSLLPSQHLVDTGYMSADMLVQSQETYQVDLGGPARKDQKWQALAGEGYAAADFKIDWINHQATASAVRLSPRAYLAVLVQHIRKRPAPRVYQVLTKALCALSSSLQVYPHETSWY